MRRLKSGVIKMTTKDMQKMNERSLFILWYEDSRGRYKFCGSFPTSGEADEFAREGLGHLRRAEWRYFVEGIDVSLLAVKTYGKYRPIVA
jgi:hypothetical protein